MMMMKVMMEKMLLQKGKMVCHQKRYSFLYMHVYLLTFLLQYTGLDLVYVSH
jgi:hypothetical protein